MYCTRCGAPNDADARYCTQCAAPLTPVPRRPDVTPPEPYPPPPAYAAPAPYDPAAKSKLMAGLLAIFLGWLGVHRFYLGQTNLGLAHLALGLIGLGLTPITCGVILLAASVWGIIDGIMILSGSVKTDAQGRPLRD